MKALLINPFFIIPGARVPYLPDEPLALEYLAAVAADEHQVRILDCVGEFPHQYRALPNGKVRLGASTEQIKDVIASWRPDIVGITMPFANQKPSVCSIARLTKEINRDIVTIVGGVYACAEPEQMLMENPSIDIVAMGEGELTFREILDKGAASLDEIKGIFYRKGDSIVRNEPREPIADIDEIPFPRRDLVPFENYSTSIYSGALKSRLNTLLAWLRFNRDWTRFARRIRHGLTSPNRPRSRMYSSARRAIILTSRGCPFNCNFCSLRRVYGGQYRMRSSQNVLDEIGMLTRDYGVGAISLADDNFNVSRQRLIEICEGVIDRGLNLTFLPTGMYLTPWLDFETFSLMKQAGFNELFFGIENASREIRERVLNKKIDLDRIEELAASCKKAGLVPGCFLMIGVPGETIETMGNTIKFGINSGIEKVQFCTFQPFPGTKLYDDCVKNGWLVDGYEPSDSLMYSSRSYVKTPDFSPEDVFNIAERGKKLLNKAGKLDQPKA